MIKAAICDDIRAERQGIQKELDRYLAEHGLKDQFEVEVFSDPRAMIRRCSVVDFDLFLLDILMPQVTGIETARELQEMLPEAQFIFITTTSEFVMDAISLKALYYLLKPYSSADFDEAMDRARNFFFGEEKTGVTLTDPDGNTVKLFIADVIYAQSSGNKKGVRIVTNDRNLDFENYSFDGLRQLFNDPSMVEAGGRLYNIENIRHITDSAVMMRNGEKFSVSKEVLRTVREAFIEYYER